MRSMEEAFNEWMRRYIDHPEQFEREFRVVQQFQSEAVPGYGQACVAYLSALMNGSI